MRVLEIGGGLDFAEEAISAECGGELGAEDLDGDLAVVLEVFGEVDGGHAALAEFANDAIAVSERSRKAFDAIHNAASVSPMRSTMGQ